MIGDVAGSGLRAATIMGRMRSTLRAYALETADPAEMIQRLERKMAHFEPDAMATVMCAVFSADLSSVQISSAGHPPPLLAMPGEATIALPVPPDILIGTRPGFRESPRPASTRSVQAKGSSHYRRAPSRRKSAKPEQKPPHNNYGGRRKQWQVSLLPEFLVARIASAFIAACARRLLVRPNGRGSPCIVPSTRFTRRSLTTAQEPSLFRQLRD